MDTLECVICLEEIKDKDKDTEYKCYSCNNYFHHKCIINLKKKKCPLCREKIIYLKKDIKHNISYKNIKFSNLTNRMNYDLDNFIIQWKNKKCLDCNHCIKIETLGEWVFDGLYKELNLRYTCMHMECETCNISQIIK